MTVLTAPRMMLDTKIGKSPCKPARADLTLPVFAFNQESMKSANAVYGVAHDEPRERRAGGQVA
jgi:hypothetical protein